MRKTIAQALESLERRMAEGFERVDGKLAGIDGRLDGIDGRLDGIDGRLDAHDGRFEKIDQQFLAVARRFDSVDHQIAGLGVNVDELRAEMYGLFDAVALRLDRLETEYQMIVAGLRRIEAQMADDRNDRTALHAQVSELRERVKQLEERLKELQERLDDEQPQPPPSKPS